MLRRLALAALALALPLATTGLTVPPDVKLNNGYIIVTDNTTYDGQAPHTTALVRIYHVFSGLNQIHQGNLGPGGSVIANGCCILAGSRYRVMALKGMSDMDYFDPDTEFVPRLCNIRGIPFGYAHVVLTGTVRFVRFANSWTATGMHVARVDTGCPG